MRVKSGDEYGGKVFCWCIKRHEVGKGVNLNVFFFFFQAEDGIRDDLVTGVQTCALPILIAETPGSIFLVIMENLYTGSTMTFVNIRCHAEFRYRQLVSDTLTFSTQC